MIKEDEMDRTYSMNGGEKEGMCVISWKDTTRKMKDLFGWIILRWILER
jgi:hypothetical protein